MVVPTDSNLAAAAQWVPAWRLGLAASENTVAPPPERISLAVRAPAQHRVDLGAFESRAVSAESVPNPAARSYSNEVFVLPVLFSLQSAAEGEQQARVCGDQQRAVACDAGTCCEPLVTLTPWAGAECLVAVGPTPVVATALPAIFAVGNAERVRREPGDFESEGPGLALTPAVVVHMQAESPLCVASYALERAVVCLAVEEAALVERSRVAVAEGVIGSFCHVGGLLVLLVHPFEASSDDERPFSELRIGGLAHSTEAVQCAALGPDVLVLVHGGAAASLDVRTAQHVSLRARELDTAGGSLRRSATRLQAALSVHPGGQRVLEVLPVDVTELDVRTQQLSVHLHAADLAPLARGRVLSPCTAVVTGYISSAWSGLDGAVLGCNGRVLQLTFAGGGVRAEAVLPRSRCKDCGGSGLCEHQRVKRQCKDCGGSGVCEHQRSRSQCKDCGGSGFCEHQRSRSQCKDCGGSSICEHQRRRDPV